MTRLKQYIKIMALFALLFGVVSIPAFFIKHQSDHSFDQIVLYPVDGVQFGSDDGSHGDNPPVQDYSIWDRIKLIGSSGVVIQSAEYTDLQANANLRESLLPVMEEQFMLLQTFNALPDLSFSDIVSASFSKVTYMDASSAVSIPESMLRIWEIQIEYRDHYILAYMDADISALYDITVLSKNNDFQYASSISENGFWDYLRLFSDGTNERINGVAIDCAYGDRIISLFPVMVSEQTGQVIPCRVGDPDRKIYEWGSPLDLESEIVEAPTTAN